MANPRESLAKDVFADMGRKVQEASEESVEEGASKLVESIPDTLCMNCYKTGTTQLLLTSIPFFREIILMSFDCEHCGFRNAEIQSAGQIQQRGSKYSLKVDEALDLNRQVVKSDTCIFRIEEIDLEIPPGRGQLTNVEGILSMIKGDLNEKQEERKQVIPEVYEKIEGIIASISNMLEGKQFPFTISAEDPAGNSWIERSPNEKAGKWNKHDYDRTQQQNIDLGLAADPTLQEVEPSETTERPEYQANKMYPEMPERQTTNNVDDEDIIEGKPYEFPASCPGCVKSATTFMKMVNIPYFKQVIIMSTVCDHCDYKSNEVKTGGAVPELGRRITLSVRNIEDMSRDILKSESCAMLCPELELSVEPGTMGGRFTTVEGLLSQVRDELRSNIFDAGGAEGGDSMEAERKKSWENFFDRLGKAIRAEFPFTVILQDPMASSYVQSFTAPEPDEQLQVEDYERTEEEKEDLGLNDMKVEGYEEDEVDVVHPAAEGDVKTSDGV